jgi:hypothetical protein
MALLAPVLFMILFAILEFGLAFLQVRSSGGSATSPTVPASTSDPVRRTTGHREERPAEFDTLNMRRVAGISR